MRLLVLSFASLLLFQGCQNYQVKGAQIAPKGLQSEFQHDLDMCRSQQKRVQPPVLIGVGAGAVVAGLPGAVIGGAIGHNQAEKEIQNNPKLDAGKFDRTDLEQCLKDKGHRI